MRFLSFVLPLSLAAPLACAQTSPAPPAANQVIIDASVTGKDGVARGLTSKDFKLSIDGKEQAIDAAAPQASVAWLQRPNKSYVVFLFDSATITTNDQSVLRQRVQQYIDSAARPDRYMAVVSWFGGMRAGQAFTTDASLLKKAMETAMQGGALAATPATNMGINHSTIAPDQAMEVQRMMDGLQSVAESLGTIRGRKTLFLFTGGRPYQSETQAYIDAAVAALNKANVAVYGVSDDVNYANHFSAETGGATIRMAFSTPDALGKAVEEQSQNYLLTFTPSTGLESGCHKVQVKAVSGGLDVRARRQYCATFAQDPLAGKAAGNALEARAAGSAAGTIPLAVNAPFFYVAADRARASVALDFVPAGVKFQKDKGKLVGEIPVVGVSTKSDGAAGPRFSDILKLAFEKQEQVDAFVKTPFHYESQVEFPAGRYTLRVAVGCGDAFGRAERALVIEPWNPTQFAVGGIAFGRARRATSTGLTAALDRTLLEGLAPLIGSGVQVVPLGATRFSVNETSAVYAEIYAPNGDPAQASKVTFSARALDRTSGAVKFDTGPVGADTYARPGSPVVPVVFDLPIKQVGPGAYKLEIRATAGGATTTRSVDYDVN